MSTRTRIKDGFLISNAIADQKRGWFVGQFVPEELGLRHQTDVEVKWGIHPLGEERPAWVHYKKSTTISVILEGQFLLHVSKDGIIEDHVLKTPGDYVIMAPGVRHSWKAITACVLLSVRFPSVAGDQFEEPGPDPAVR